MTAVAAPAQAETTSVSRQTASKATFWSVCFGHMAVDAFNSSGGVLLAFLAGHVMPLTNTQIGLAISLYQLTGALSQPYFGWRADRTGARNLGALSVVWTAAMMMLALLVASLTGSFVLMLIPFVIGALGSGAFHPIGSMYAAESGKSPSGTATHLSLFFLMGQSGSAIMPPLFGALLDSTATNNNAFTAALGPAFNGLLIEHGYISALAALVIVALPPALWMLFAIPQAHLRHQKTGTSAVQRAVSFTPLIVLGVIVTLRGMANPGMVAFLPRLFQLKGWTAAEYGLITGGFWLAGGLTGMLFSYLTRRYHTRVIIALSLLAAAPFLFILPTLNGPEAFIFAFVIGSLSGGSHSIIVGLSQRLMPTGKGFSSGLTLGFIFGTGALGTIVVGALADRITLPTAFQVVAIVLLITGLVAFALPKDERAST